MTGIAIAFLWIFIGLHAGLFFNAGNEFLVVSHPAIAHSPGMTHLTQKR
jgi:hypothetical protein